MARYAKLDKSQYGANGMIPLHRGDDWSLVGKVVDRYAGYEKEVDCTSVTSASGFFPAASGGYFAEALTWLDKSAGNFAISCSKADSLNTALSPAGSGIYIQLVRGTSVETVDTLDQALEIIDPGTPQ